MLAKGRIGIVLKVVGLIFRLVGVHDSIDVVEGEIEESSIVVKVLLDLLRSGTLSIGVCAVVARPDSDNHLLVEVGGELARNVILCAERRAEPCAHS